VGRAVSRVLPDGLVVLVTLVLTWPMWTSGGYGLARDMVFTPRHPWSLDAVGLGDAAPRAVPLDAVLAAATSVLDGAVIFRFAVAGVLLLAGAGAHRLLADLLPDVPPVARCVAAVAAVWNPYVVERLALGQWALLAGYAALFWVLPAVRRRAWPAVIAWTWLGSLTPTGGAALVLVAVAAVAVALARGRDRAAAGWWLLVSVLAQVPWLAAGLAGSAVTTSDPAGVAAFAARAERAGSVWPTLLGTGGLWSPFEVPASLGGVLGHVLTVAVAVALLVGARRVVRQAPVLGIAAAAGFVLAGAAHLPGGEAALEWLVVHVPGTGLLRDGQKWLLPYVALVAVSAGAATASAAAALRRRDADLGRLLPAALVLVPVLVLPDAAGRTWAALDPVEYPADLAEAVAVLDEQEGGDVATAPWSSYRRFSWGNDLSAADPLPRWTRHPAVVADSLTVSGATVGGEDARAASVGAVLGAGAPVAEDLVELGVGWVLVYLDQPGAGDLDLTGAERVVDGPDVALYRLPGVDAGADHAPTGWVVGLDVLWGLAWLGGLAGALGMATKRRRDC
jgi:hypothetical protein